MFDDDDSKRIISNIIQSLIVLYSFNLPEIELSAVRLNDYNNNGPSWVDNLAVNVVCGKVHDETDEVNWDNTINDSTIHFAECQKYTYNQSCYKIKCGHALNDNPGNKVAFRLRLKYLSKIYDNVFERWCHQLICPINAMSKDCNSHSLGNHLDLVNRMVARWGSHADNIVTDSE